MIFPFFIPDHPQFVEMIDFSPILHFFGEVRRFNAFQGIWQMGEVILYISSADF